MKRNSGETGPPLINPPEEWMLNPMPEQSIDIAPAPRCFADIVGWEAIARHDEANALADEEERQRRVRRMRRVVRSTF